MAGSWEPLEPPVWKWYRVYAGVMAAMYLLVTVAGVVLAVLAPDSDGEPFPRFIGLMYAVIGVPFAAAYLAAFFIPRAPWAWIYHLVLICIGLTSICCMPATIPLLIYWLKPEAKQFFGRAA
jgi:MFS family permease